VIARTADAATAAQVWALAAFWERNMPYALFCNEAKLSKTYPTEADVWKLAQQSGLVVDAAPDHDKSGPRRILDKDYEIRPCFPDPDEDPAENQAEAERRSRIDLQFDA
jgi:hypothetical protein